MSGPKRRSIYDRFESKYEIAKNGCWIWTGGRFNHGYGAITSGGRNGVNKLAHRVSYEKHIGEIPEGMDVCHRCDTPLCVNPEHLFLGTARDNMQDMMQKNRRVFSKGSACYQAKLTEEKVLKIRKLCSEGLKKVDIAKMFAVSPSIISDICRRVKWTHI